MNKPLPSDHYFNTVTTPEQFSKFLSTGMAFEWEPNCPTSWGEHKMLYNLWMKHKEYDGS